MTGGNLEFSTTGVRAVTGDIILDAVEKIKIDRLQTTGTQRIELNDNDIRANRKTMTILFLIPIKVVKKHNPKKNTKVTAET